jgi:hypothetical protein
VGTVDIVGGEPGAQVEINGRIVGTMPLPEPVHALVGRALVQVSLAGFHRATSEVAVEPGRLARLHVTLVPRADEGAQGDATDDWVLPLAIGGGALVLGGVVVAIVLATLPTEPTLPDVLATVTTLEVRF